MASQWYQDLQLPAGTWVEIYSSLGIPVGSALTIQNKISAGCLMQLRSDQPPTTVDGYALASSATTYVYDSPSGVWIRCTTAGRIVIIVNGG